MIPRHSQAMTEMYKQTHQYFLIGRHKGICINKLYNIPINNSLIEFRTGSGITHTDKYIN